MKHIMGLIGFDQSTATNTIALKNKFENGTVVENLTSELEVVQYKAVNYTNLYNLLTLYSEKQLNYCVVTAIEKLDNGDYEISCNHDNMYSALNQVELSFGTPTSNAPQSRKDTYSFHVRDIANPNKIVASYVGDKDLGIESFSIGNLILSRIPIEIVYNDNTKVVFKWFDWFIAYVNNGSNANRVHFYNTKDNAMMGGNTIYPIQNSTHFSTEIRKYFILFGDNDLIFISTNAELNNIRSKVHFRKEPDGCVVLTESIACVISQGVSELFNVQVLERSFDLYSNSPNQNIVFPSVPSKFIEMNYIYMNEVNVYIPDYPPYYTMFGLKVNTSGHRTSVVNLDGYKLLLTVASSGLDVDRQVGYYKIGEE